MRKAPVGISRALGLLASLLCLVALPAACAKGSGPGAEPEQAAADLKNSDLQQNQRILALEQVWEAARQDPARLSVAREASKDLIWKGGAPVQLRQKALALLLTDDSPDGQADTRKLLALRLPTEGAWPMLVDICRGIQARGSSGEWKSLTASLVRSYARKVPVPPDPDRPERDALVALHPGVELERVVYEVFVRPADNGAPERPDDFAEKSRQAAWDLLGRLDPEGERRTAMIAAEARDEPVLKDLARSARELGVTPITGSELSWLKNLLSGKDIKNAAWWSQTSAAVALLSPEQRAGLSLRHLEAVRFAAASRSEWFAASRDVLLGELGSRLEGRRPWLKSSSGEGGQRSREMLGDWRDRLSFGDVLSLLLIDDALRDPKIVDDLFRQADNDRADTTTEYGGVLFVKDQAPTPLRPDSGLGEAFMVRSYTPRPAQRVNDRTFVASEEMFAQSGRGVAHYHFHAQSDRNSEYAGPGKGDNDYADAHGRACLVFTSVRSGIMNADYYHRGGVVIDLGEVRRRE